IAYVGDKVGGATSQGINQIGEGMQKAYDISAQGQVDAERPENQNLSYAGQVGQNLSQAGNTAKALFVGGVKATEGTLGVISSPFQSLPDEVKNPVNSIFGFAGDVGRGTLNAVQSLTGKFDDADVQTAAEDASALMAQFALPKVAGKGLKVASNVAFAGAKDLMKSQVTPTGKEGASFLFSHPDYYKDLADTGVISKDPTKTVENIKAQQDPLRVSLYNQLQSIKTPISISTVVQALKDRFEGIAKNDVLHSPEEKPSMISDTIENIQNILKDQSRNGNITFSDLQKTKEILSDSYKSDPTITQLKRSMVDDAYHYLKDTIDTGTNGISTEINQKLQTLKVAKDAVIERAGKEMQQGIGSITSALFVGGTGFAFANPLIGATMLSLGAIRMALRNPAIKSGTISTLNVLSNALNKASKGVDIYQWNDMFKKAFSKDAQAPSVFKSLINSFGDEKPTVEGMTQKVKQATETLSKESVFKQFMNDLEKNAPQEKRFGINTEEQSFNSASPAESANRFSDTTGAIGNVRKIPESLKFQDAQGVKRMILDKFPDKFTEKGLKKVLDDTKNRARKNAPTYEIKRAQLEQMLAIYLENMKK
ncbi:MAG: hypothetical protein WCG95_08840, partial [bacterium]